MANKIASLSILSKGKIIPYQNMIEEMVGPFLARHLPYKDSSNMTKEEKAYSGVWKDDSCFIGDADYIITITKIKSV